MTNLLEKFRGLEPVVTTNNGTAVTTSKEVARVFGKRHDHVLRDIRAIISELPAEALPNFGEGVYTLPATADQKHPQFTMTRDGFTLLAMGFTGKQAMAFKINYMTAFNRMEAALKTASEDRFPKIGETVSEKPEWQLPPGNVVVDERLLDQVLWAANRITKQFQQFERSMVHLQQDVSELQLPAARLAHAAKFRHLEPNVMRAEVIRFLSAAGKDGMSWDKLAKKSALLKGGKTNDVVNHMIKDGEVARLVLPKTVMLYLRQFAPKVETHDIA